MTRAVERLTGGVQTLADLLGLKAPDLPTAASISKSGLQIVESQSTFTIRDDGPIPGGIWDDEEEKRFYEDIVDLKELVPASLLGIKDQAAAEGKADQVQDTTAEERQKAEEEDIKRQLESLTAEDGEVTATTQEPSAVAMDKTGSATTIGSPIPPAHATLDEDEPPVDTTGLEDEGLQAGPAARLNVLFAALPEAVNREMVDKLAVEFATLNSKAARKRLIRVSNETRSSHRCAHLIPY